MNEWMNKHIREWRNELWSCALHVFFLFLFLFSFLGLEHQLTSANAWPQPAHKRRLHLWAPEREPVLEWTMISPLLVLAIGTCLTTSLVPGRIGGHRRRDGETWCRWDRMRVVSVFRVIEPSQVFKSWKQMVKVGNPSSPTACARVVGHAFPFYISLFFN